MMNRRSFLHKTIHALAAPGVLGTMGFTLPGRKTMENLLRKAAESDRVLVMIFLEGGNDGLNTVVPLDRMSELNALRPRVVLKENDLNPLRGSDVGLHPKLVDLKDLYNEGRLQVIQNVGYPNQNFSHFRSTDIWMSGSDADEVVNSGWMGRKLQLDHPDFPEAYPTGDMKDPLAVEINFGSSLLFQGPANSMSVTIESVESFYQFVENIEQEAPDTPAGEKLKYIRLIARQSEQYGERIKEVAARVNNHVDYPANNYLADQLKIVSKMIAGGSRTPVYLVRLFGFDTHDSQVNTSDHSEGEHANLLTLLNDAIKAFMQDLEYHKTDEKVLGMTFSEFGRTILSNASNGTDHGSAAPLFFFGNAVKGGVTGNNPQIDRNMTYEDNLAYEYDFRQLYSSVLEQWFGVDTGIRNELLFGEFNTVEIIGESSQVLSASTPVLKNALKVYPNPLNGVARLEFEGSGNHVDISLWDLQGRKIDIIFRGKSRNGLNKIIWNTENIIPGRYTVVVDSPFGRKSIGVVKQ